MNRKLFLLIPVIVGVLLGYVFSLYSNQIDDSILLTEANLIRDGSPIMGQVSAPITILEWGDFQCTFCYKFHQNTLELIDNEFIKSGKAKVVFKNFPLNGQDSILAAEAAFCAQDQKKYWEYHDELYNNWKGERTGWINRGTLSTFADNVDLNVEKFNDCLNSQKYANLVNQHYKFGKEIGIDATPSFLVFNKDSIIKITGNQPIEVFQKTIEKLLNENSNQT